MYDVIAYSELEQLAGIKLRGETAELRGLMLEESILREKNLFLPLLSAAKTANFNFVFFPLNIGGLSIYKSPIYEKYKLSPIFPQIKKSSIIRELLEIAGKDMVLGGVKEIFYFTAGEGIRIPRRLRRYYKAWAMRTAEDKLIEIKKEILTQNSEVRRWWLCPTNKGYRKFLADILTEAAEEMPLAAIVFDVQELAELPSICFCENCREKVREFAGEMDFRHWTSGIAEEEKEALGLQWLKWMHGEIFDFLGYLKARLQSQRRDLLIVLLSRRSALMPQQSKHPLPWLYLWQEFLVDELFLTDYPANPDAYFMELSADTKELSTEGLFAPIITTTEIENLRGIIRRSKSSRATGWVFKYNRHILLAELEELGKDLLKEEAFPGELAPFQACKLLGEEIYREISRPKELRRFFFDFLRIIGILNSARRGKWLQSVLSNLMSFNQRIKACELEITATNPDRVKIALQRMETLLAYLLEKFG